AATGGHARLAVTQKSDNKRGRQLGDAIALAALEGDAHAMGRVHEVRRPFAAAGDASDSSPYRWGMTIDVDKCTGCSACAIACSIENNIPTVGEEQVLRSRQMSWLRIERWIGDGVESFRGGRPPLENHEQLGRIDVRNSPMLCQHCGAAPCEPVCP